MFSMIFPFKSYQFASQGGRIT